MIKEGSAPKNTTTVLEQGDSSQKTSENEGGKIYYNIYLLVIS